MRFLLAIILLVAPVPALSQSPGAAPVVRTTLKPSEGIVIGQPVTVNVAVLFPGEMLHPPQVRIPEAAGAQIMRFESQGVTIRDTIDGQAYVGQTFEFVAFPRRGGIIVIPAAAVTLLARNGDPVGSAKGEQTKLEVNVPPDIDPSEPVLVADRVSVMQSWSPAPGTKQFKAGDAIVRMIERRAEGVPALGMAEFRFTAPDGVRVYVDQPVVDDRSTRIGIDGHRTDKATYVFEKPGSFDLPALHQPWLSLPGKAVREETLSGITVSVAPPASGRGTSHGSMPWAMGALILTGGVLFALAAWLAHRHWRIARERYWSSPAFSRRELTRVARMGDAVATYRTLAQWRLRLAPEDRILLDRGPAVRPLLARLERANFSSNGDWDADSGHDLARAVAGWAPPTASLGRTVVLPPLNPAERTPTPIQNGPWVG
ncbi:hypothetical protein [Bosea sp. BH3]|uniref:hypothetical protein n=1 Tax=Bosea sp. BH3 TaxID=2871701 RepID=UPI0021CB7D65|nr:hypothetical protein [Bosea sp. BH3]MCU4179858.1 hypothetical protein [Bosea sp. BH3]